MNETHNTQHTDGAQVNIVDWTSHQSDIATVNSLAAQWLERQR